jgi:hypothetical protein
MDPGASNFYVEQARCAMCNRPTPRIAIQAIDTLKGKEPVVCGFCLVELAKTAAEQTRKDSDEKAFRK